MGAALVGFDVASARVNGINFQACSFNHSDISPFKINELRSSDSDYRTRRRIPNRFCHLVCVQRFDACENGGLLELCNTRKFAAISYGDLVD